MKLFSPREKYELKRNGFLVKNDVVDRETIDSAREAFWDGVPYDRDDYETLVDAPERFENAWEHIQNPEPFAAINEQLFPYAEALADEGTLERPDERIQVTPRFPNGELREEGDLPRSTVNWGTSTDIGPHFDANHEVGHYTVITSLYIDRGEPRGQGIYSLAGLSLVRRGVLPRPPLGEHRQRRDAAGVRRRGAGLMRTLRTSDRSLRDSQRRGNDGPLTPEPPCTAGESTGSHTSASPRYSGSSAPTPRRLNGMRTRTP